MTIIAGNECVIKLMKLLFEAIIDREKIRAELDEALEENDALFLKWLSAEHKAEIAEIKNREMENEIIFLKKKINDLEK